MQQKNWIQPIRYFTVATVFLAIIWLIVSAVPLISTLVIAGLIAYILHPFVNYIARHTKLTHGMAVNIVYLIFFFFLIAIPAILTPIIINQISSISVDFQQVGGQIETFIEEPLIIGNLTIPLDNLFNDLGQLITQTVTDLAANLANVLAGISTNFLWILVILVSVYYLLKDSHILIAWIVSLFSEYYQYHAHQLLAEIDLIWGNFLRGQLSLMIIIGFMSWIGGVVVGLPGAFVIGITAGILDFVPSLGPTLGAIIALVVALFQGSTLLPVSNGIFAVIIVIIYIVIQQIENIWIRPYIMGWRLKLHPAIVFVGVFGSLALFGVLVTLIIVPLMATIGVVGRYVRCVLQGINPYPYPVQMSDE